MVQPTVDQLGGSKTPSKSHRDRSVGRACGANRSRLHTSKVFEGSHGPWGLGKKEVLCHPDPFLSKHIFSTASCSSLPVRFGMRSPTTKHFPAVVETNFHGNRRDGVIDRQVACACACACATTRQLRCHRKAICNISPERIGAHLSTNVSPLIWMCVFRMMPASVGSVSMQ